jgi:hypothetical protein
VINPTVRSYSVRRYYDPQSGQFLSVDPLVDQTEAPYAYVAGDPVDEIDPNGLGIGSWLENNVVHPVVGGAVSGWNDAVYGFMAGTTALGNDIADSPIAQPFLGLTTNVGNVLGGAYYDFASAHPCLALGISATVQIAGIFFFPEDLGLEGLAAAARFTPEQDALIQLAKDAQRRGGLTSEEGALLRQWADEYGLPSRGPEAHSGSGFGSNPHYHIGPVNHIPAR